MIENEHELKFINSFIKKEKQERYLNLISSNKGRVKFRTYLSHFNDFKEEYLHNIKSSDQNQKYIEEFLRSKQVSKMCYIISENSEFDKRTMPIAEALELLFARGIAYILSCSPGKLAYYESGDMKERYYLF